MDLPIFVLKLVPFYGTPIVIGITWWMWLQTKPATHPRWRAAALLLGLVAVTANGVMFYSWIGYRGIVGEWSDAWRVNDFLGNDIAVYLVLAGLVGAVVGQGRERTLVALLATMGFLLWIPVPLL